MAECVAKNLRREDRRLMRSWCKSDPSVLAYMQATESLLSWVIMNPDMDPVAMIGVDHDDELPNVGAGWMYSTKRVGEARWSLARGVHDLVQMSRMYWPEIRLRPEPWNAQQRRFLKFVGFQERNGEMRACQAETSGETT